jgi:Flp pilus assembly protein TadD
VVGQLIGVSGIFAVTRLGPRTNRLMDEAVALGPDNPRVWMLKGISSIHKPRMFGGGLDNAERDLKKAIGLFPADSARAPKPSWGHAEAWAWLGRVYADLKRVDDARAAYTRALEIEPGFDWVRHHLLPALDPSSR